MTIEEAIQQTQTMAQAAALLDMPFTTFKRKAGNLYKPNQGAKGTSKAYNNALGPKINTQDILDGKHPQYSTRNLKERLIKEGILTKICSECGITDEWNNKPITLQLDHINGVRDDHRLENLRLLCPNCHSQTDTYCGRNKPR